MTNTRMVRATEPRAGDIGLTQIHGPVGRFIQFGQWACGDGFSDYQHAFIVTGNGTGLIEAEPGGARIGGTNEYAARETVYIRPEGMSAMQGDVVAQAAMRYLGIPYSFLDYLAIAAHRFHLPFPGLKGYVADTKHMICSQLVDQAYQDAGIHLFADGRWPGYVTPADLANLLKGSQ